MQLGIGAITVPKFVSGLAEAIIRHNKNDVKLLTDPISVESTIKRF